MPVSEVTTDPEALTMTLVAEVAAPVERLWDALTNPRQLERFWGPPGWPATFTDFDFTVGGRARYHMTSPQGERSRGGWEFLAIEPTSSFSVLDAFVGEDGEPIEEMPAMRMVFALESTPDGARLTNTSYFTSADALEQVVAMGAVEGSTMAMAQLDRVVEGLRAFAQGQGTQTTLVDDTHVRITRLIDGPRELVWRAHTEPELLKKWQLGPEGWRMSICEFEPVAGTSYRLGWEPEEGTEGEAFGFDGDIVLAEEPRRLVTTEHMTGTDYPSTLNDLNLEEEDGATLVVFYIEYPDKETRDIVLATGMTDGMEASFARLDALVPAL